MEVAEREFDPVERLKEAQATYVKAIGELVRARAALKPAEAELERATASVAETEARLAKAQAAVASAVAGVGLRATLAAEPVAARPMAEKTSSSAVTVTVTGSGRTVWLAHAESTAEPGSESGPEPEPAEESGAGEEPERDTTATEPAETLPGHVRPGTDVGRILACLVRAGGRHVKIDELTGLLAVNRGEQKNRATVSSIIAALKKRGVPIKALHEDRPPPGESQGWAYTG